MPGEKRRQHPRNGPDADRRPRDVSQRPANYQTTSDFAVLLENTLHKMLRAAYGITPDTWSKFCGDCHRSRLPRAQLVSHGRAVGARFAEATPASSRTRRFPTARRRPTAVGTKGNIIAISRQTIVNDDLGAVMQLTSARPRRQAHDREDGLRAARAELGLGPTYGAAPLFHMRRTATSRPARRCRPRRSTRTA
jgi:hypothetical protein